METTKTIGQDLTICNYSTKQRGYGRQSLYLSFLEMEGEHYFNDVFPNVEEHFDILLNDDAFFNEEKGYYTDGNGNGHYSEDQVFDSVTDALNAILKGREIEVETEDENEG